MDLYLAGLASCPYSMEYVKEFNQSVENKIGVMCTFASPRLVDKCIDFGFEKIFLDSGAFSFFNSGKNISIDDLISFIKEREDHLTEYISLDVIADKEGSESLANWYYMREAGLDPMPVYHQGENWDVFNKYMENNKYICLGGLVGTSIDWKSIAKFCGVVFSKSYGENINYHILGANDIRIVQRYPFYSCDALTWRVGSRFGEIITPIGRWPLTRKHNKYDEYTTNHILGEWLTKEEIPFPLSDEFDLKQLDIINIRQLYRNTVEFHDHCNVDENVIINLELF